MQNHNPIVLKVSHYFRRYANMHSMLKKIYYFTCYILSYGSRKHSLIDDVIPYFPIKMSSDYFFGYYHNSPWSYDDRFIAINSLVDSETIQINIIDKDKLIPVDKTTLWNFQQGPMLGWIPDEHTIHYNKLINGKHKAVTYNVNNKEFKYFDFPVQSIHPSGSSYFSINYNAISRVNKDYGYEQKNSLIPHDAIGIWKCYFGKKVPELFLSENNLFEINVNFKKNQSNEINHILYSSDGSQFLFIYRYVVNNKKYSKLILSNSQSKDNLDLRVVNRDFISHMCWIDNQKIFYFGDAPSNKTGYYIYNIPKNDYKQVMIDNLVDGHPSLSANKQWISLDTYPDKCCKSHLYLYNLKDDRVIDIGNFFTNVLHQGYNRCDLHPRWSNRGSKLLIDTLQKDSRSSFVIDLDKVINNEK